MRTRARIRHRRQERVLRQASDRIRESLTADQRRVLQLAAEGYEPGEVARELALEEAYVASFQRGLVERLTGEGIIPSPEWRNAMAWAEEQGLLSS